MSKPEPYYEQDGITIYHGDSREIMPTLGIFGAVITDPPYVLGMNSTEGKVGWGDLMNSASFYGAWISDALGKTAIAQGPVWVFCSWRSFPILARAAYEIGSKIASLLVWDKATLGPGGHIGLRPTYEMVALFPNEGFTIEDRCLNDIWRVPLVPSANKRHAAEKPVGLMRQLIEVSGDRGPILDPFMGSGTTLEAAKQVGREAVGIEIEERYCEIAAKRLQQSVLFGEPFTETFEDAVTVRGRLIEWRPGD